MEKHNTLMRVTQIVIMGLFPGDLIILSLKKFDFQGTTGLKILLKYIFFFDLLLHFYFLSSGDVAGVISGDGW